MYRWKWNNSCLDFTHPFVCRRYLQSQFVIYSQGTQEYASKNVKFMDVLFKAFENSLLSIYQLKYTSFSQTFQGTLFFQLHKYHIFVCTVTSMFRNFSFKCVFLTICLKTWCLQCISKCTKRKIRFQIAIVNSAEMWSGKKWSERGWMSYFHPHDTGTYTNICHSL